MCSVCIVSRCQTAFLFKKAVWQRETVIIMAFTFERLHLRSLLVTRENPRVIDRERPYKTDIRADQFARQPLME